MNSKLVGLQISSFEFILCIIAFLQPSQGVISDTKLRMRQASDHISEAGLRVVTSRRWFSGAE